MHAPSYLATGGREPGQSGRPGGPELLSVNSTETHFRYTFDIILQMLIAARQFLENPEKSGFR